MLDPDYETDRHHLSVLAEAGAVECAGDGYGAVYPLSSRTRRHWDLVEGLAETREAACSSRFPRSTPPF